MKHTCFSAFILCSTIIVGCTETTSSAPEAAPAARDEVSSWVSSAPLVAATSEHLGSWFAEVQLVSGSTKTLSAPIEGRLVAWRVKPGDHVKAGEPFAEIVAEEIADLATAQRELQRRIQAQEEMLKGRLAQLATGVIATSEVEQLRASLEMDRAHAVALGQQRRVRMSDLKSAKGNRIVWSSPTDGEVTALGCAEGQRIMPQDACVTLVHVQAPEVTAYLSERDLPRLNDVSSATMRTESGAHVTVTFSRLDPVVDPGHRMVKSYWQMVEPVPASLMPGMSGRLVLDKTPSIQAMKVARQALTQLDGQDVVFAKKSDVWAPEIVEVLKEYQGDVVFTSATLAPGDEVATRGVFSLKSAHVMKGE